MYRLKFHKLKVLNINYINTDWSILFFFDLKDYISYCKDVYKYFNLSSVNFFVAGLKYRLFLVWPYGSEHCIILISHKCGKKFGPQNVYRIYQYSVGMEVL